MSIQKQLFGTDRLGHTVTKYTMTNASGASVSVLDYGAHIQSVIVPDKNGNMADVCLGFDSLQPYTQRHSCIGATLGRYANRIGGAEFQLNGQTYHLTVNEKSNHIHGGKENFSFQWWVAQTQESEEEDTISMTYHAHDGEEGYPGKMHVQVTFDWSRDNHLTIRYFADCDKDTILNLTNHAYFNLAGSGDILSHTLCVHSDKVTDVTPDLIPTGDFVDVENTPLDLRAIVKLSDAIARKNEQKLMAGANGFDLNYCLQQNGISECAVLADPASGRKMRVLTDQPGVQVYSGQGLHSDGKNGVYYGAYAGIALETQHYPDSIHHDNFPSVVLKKGDVFQSTTIYAFE